MDKKEVIKVIDGVEYIILEEYKRVVKIAFGQLRDELQIIVDEIDDSLTEVKNL